MIDIVGVDAAGAALRDPAVRAMVADAEIVVGSDRLLDQLPDHEGQERVPWPSPLRPALPGLVCRIDGRRAVVLASGDPLVSGIGSTFVDLVGIDEIRIHPVVSSVALARARMGWSAEESTTVTLVGRKWDRLRLHLAPDERLVVLTHGDDAPQRIAGLLVEEGYGASTITVLGDLGADNESRLDLTAADVPAQPAGTIAAPRLHLCCIEVRRDAAHDGLSRVPGLPDSAYENDGQLTKQIVRAGAIAQLAPRPGELLWDLGAGSGSIGIEWSRQHPRNRAIAIERDEKRAQRIARNADRLGVPDLEVTVAASADAIAQLPPPDAVFIGGGLSTELIARCWNVLRAHGRLVVHAVTIESEQLLLAAHGEYGGQLVRLQVEELEPLGSMRGWKPARPIVQWSVTKPPSAEITLGSSELTLGSAEITLGSAGDER
ncbi:precorrin-6y C5,15-methyltransferase (decarboxylating) subunit CbiE [Epidermidibacterium keratini]|uniref:Precorrin-6y C5,15-methyltransferase (Decarboxylating) subunit CbiE n=1 Tax=Epidermidibacterium keratini TaxID=1891644 RepID=A0A7L4YLC6_9ACTN|nr:precorrin-6y C5,15-methyltransferase (decarboxylating) subunit CbiE [Epidermidibacterium keratini]QHB99867.1 precorrin-6y C5,15-methyltransferase (decarboxylating) subunit CbiE [Epidermidibacterium keratini]